MICHAKAKSLYLKCNREAEAGSAEEQPGQGIAVVHIRSRNAKWGFGNYLQGNKLQRDHPAYAVVISFSFSVAMTKII